MFDPMKCPEQASNLHKSHNTPLLLPRNLDRHCFRFHNYTKVFGEKEVHYGILQLVNMSWHRYVAHSIQWVNELNDT